MNIEDLLQKLEGASGDNERSWLITQDLLASLSNDLTKIIWAATIPDWFNIKTLIALRPELRNQVEYLYRELQELPFVEPFENKGYNIHELTRNSMLNHLQKNNWDEYLLISKRLADYIVKSQNNTETQKDLSELTKIRLRFYKALSIYGKIQDKLGEANTLCEIARVNRNLSEFADTQNCYEKALIIYRALNDKILECITLEELGNTFYELGQSRKALGFQEQALVIAREIGDQHREGIILSNIGVNYKNLGESRKGIEFQEQALAIAREIGDRPQERIAISNLGIAYKNLGKVEQAISLHKQALAIAEELGDQRSIGVALGNLGVAYKNINQYTDAIQFQERALTIAQEVNDRRGEGNVLGNLGLAYTALGQTQKAIQFYEQALIIARDMGDRRHEGVALGNLGTAYTHLGNIQEAILFHEQYLAIAREVNDRRAEANALINLGNAYINLGEVKKAKMLLQQALSILQVIESPNAKNVQNSLDAIKEEKELIMSNPDIPKIVNPNASHMACLFLLDTSGSMQEDGKINQLNTGFNKFIQDLSKNEDTKRILDLAIIEFNSTSSVIQEFAPISYVQSIALSADGGTNMVPAIEKAIEMVRDRSRFYRDNTGTEPYKPWIFLITDGEPTDERNEFIKVADKVNNLVNQGRFKMFAIGVDGYNPAPLHSLCGERVISLNGHDFTDTFDWINKSIRTVSQAAPAANIGVSNLPTTGTMSVDPSKDTTGW